MIGIYCQDEEKTTVREFFELFKTPWEYCNPNGDYDVILSTKPEMPPARAKLMILYSSAQTEFDASEGVEVFPVASRVLRTGKFHVPIHRNMASIKGGGISLLQADENIAMEFVAPQMKVIRVGFDLFQEISTLLSEGQSIENAAVPAIDTYIALLRDWIISADILLMEIPPVPLGRTFFACLTHDVDFAGIRRHKFDHTMWGFVYRATIGSMVNFFNGRINFLNLMRNWRAAIKLPFIFIGILDDFWEHFEKYAEIDPPQASTFFFIPFKNTPGENFKKNGISKRAADYDITDIIQKIDYLLDKGCEIGLHGLDAWHSIDLGLREKQQILECTNTQRVGVRIHWLFFNPQSPAMLERAGFDYDTSLGFNETIGFRNGTTQVFQPVEANRLLELPLNIQDTSLFYPRRLHLNNDEARKLCLKILDSFSIFGGALTVSWHERSLEPERLWGDFYMWLLKELKDRGAWVTRADQIVDWFRRRRSVRFGECTLIHKKMMLRVSGSRSTSGPQMFIRIHASSSSGRSQVDIPWNGEDLIEIPFEEREAG